MQCKVEPPDFSHNEIIVSEFPFFFVDLSIKTFSSNELLFYFAPCLPFMNWFDRFGRTQLIISDKPCINTAYSIWIEDFLAGFIIIARVLFMFVIVKGSFF